MKQLSLTFIFLIITSCSIPVSVTLFNNSGADQMVIIGADSIRISEGSSKYIKNIEHVDFSIESEAERHLYSTESIPNSSIFWRGWGPFSKCMLYLQLEPDGKIWVSTSNKLENNFGEQPDSFPLIPNL